MERAGEVVVEVVEPSSTFSLRQRVLRPHQTVAEMNMVGDDDPRSACLAIRDDDGEIVATGSVRPESPPWVPGSPTHESHSSHAPYDPPSAAVTAAGDGYESSWRLRGMATDAGLRNAGLGARILAAAIDHVAENGGGLLWCSARIGAVSFYERAGFQRLGETYDEPHIGTHTVMWRTVP
ncbi:MAG TPA: GNAT family N-acetyltransferase [Acidimicrobiales bacterium]|nr:GNAT family N-acetyltransferase [Acidimicrobiales bacterium]